MNTKHGEEKDHGLLRTLFLEHERKEKPWHDHRRGDDIDAALTKAVLAKLSYQGRRDGGSYSY